MRTFDPTDSNSFKGFDDSGVPGGCDSIRPEQQTQGRKRKVYETGNDYRRLRALGDHL